MTDSPPEKPALEAHAEQVASLIFVADRSISIMQAAGEGAEAINATGLGDLFSSIHGALIDTAFLAIAKVFERPRPPYALWSLPALLSAIGENAERLPITDRAHGLTFLRELAPTSPISLTATDREITSALLRAMQAQLPDPSSTQLRPHDLALDALRQQRDKVIAHSEAIDHGTLLSASWQDLDNLLDLAKTHIDIIGRVFFRTVYMTDDKHYLLTDDAARAGMAMRRLLTKAGLRPPRHPSGAV
jgi:hypothetical protein